MTYPLLSVIVLAVVAAATAPAIRRERGRPLLWTAVILLILTLVFDNVIVGLGIVGYDDSLISGIRVPYAPIEDFAYALAAVVLVPALWRWWGRLSPARSKGANDAA